MGECLGLRKMDSFSRRILPLNCHPTLLNLLQFHSFQILSDNHPFPFFFTGIHRKVKWTITWISSFPAILLLVNSIQIRHLAVIPFPTIPSLHSLAIPAFHAPEMVHHPLAIASLNLPIFFDFFPMPSVHMLPFSHFLPFNAHRLDFRQFAFERAV